MFNRCPIKNRMLPNWTCFIFRYLKNMFSKSKQANTCFVAIFGHRHVIAGRVASSIARFITVNLAMLAHIGGSASPHHEPLRPASIVWGMEANSNTRQMWLGMVRRRLQEEQEPWACFAWRHSAAGAAQTSASTSAHCGADRISCTCRSAQDFLEAERRRRVSHLWTSWHCPAMACCERGSRCMALDVQASVQPEAVGKSRQRCPARVAGYHHHADSWRETWWTAYWWSHRALSRRKPTSW